MADDLRELAQTVGGEHASHILQLINEARGESSVTETTWEWFQRYIEQFNRDNGIDNQPDLSTTEIFIKHFDRPTTHEIVYRILVSIGIHLSNKMNQTSMKQPTWDILSNIPEMKIQITTVWVCIEVFLVKIGLPMAGYALSMIKSME